MADGLPALPANFKPIQHYLKTASEHDKRDPVVAYYCRLYAMQKGMEIDRKSPECRKFLQVLMNNLEETKKAHKENEAIQSEVVGQAHLENYALKLFLYADNEDRAARFGKNVVKSFYTAGMLMDVLTTFGELSEEVQKNVKYAKWKAAYIHNCLKNGETPQSGPLGDDMDMNFGGDDFGGAGGGGEDFRGHQPSNSADSRVDPAHSYPSPSNQPAHQPAWPNQQPPAGQPTWPNQPPPTQPAASTYPVPTPRGPAAVTPSRDTSYHSTPPAQASGVQLKSEDFTKAMKLCKYASSALQYEDSKTAIDNLTKALNLLTTGKE